MSTSYYNLGVTSGGFGTATVQLLINFCLTGSNQMPAVNAQMFNAQSPCSPQVFTLNSGANTINATDCPALATAGGVVITPVAGNTNTLTLKGISGDTGIPLAPSAPFVWTFTPGSPPSSFVITASNTTVVDLVFF